MADTSAATIACPYCAETVLAAAKKCKHCQEIIDPALREARGATQMAVTATATHQKKPKDKTVAVVLALLLGGLGLHKFYLDQPIMGLVYLLFCWTFIPVVISFFDALLLAFMSQQAFHQRYG